MNNILIPVMIAVLFFGSMHDAIKAALHSIEIKKKVYERTKEGKEEYWKDCRKGLWLTVKSILCFIGFIIYTKTYLLEVVK